MNKTLLAMGMAAALALNIAAAPEAAGKAAPSAEHHASDAHAGHDGAISGGPKKAGTTGVSRVFADEKGRSGASGGIVFSSDVLGLLKMEKAELKSKLAEGKSLAQIAEERGVSREALKKALTDAFDKRMEERKAKFSAHLDRLIDARWNGWIHQHGKSGGKDQKKSHLFSGAEPHGTGTGGSVWIPGTLSGRDS